MLLQTFLNSVALLQQGFHTLQLTFGETCDPGVGIKLHSSISAETGIPLSSTFRELKNSGRTQAFNFRLRSSTMVPFVLQHSRS